MDVRSSQRMFIDFASARAGAGPSTRTGAGGGFEAPGGRRRSRDPDDFVPLVDDARPPRSVAAVAEDRPRRRLEAGLPSKRTLLVAWSEHLSIGCSSVWVLFPRRAPRSLATRSFACSRRRKSRPVTAERRSPIAGQAASSLQAICSRPDIRAIYLSGDPWHEVPFTMWMDDGAVVRGTIDCVIRDPDGPNDAPRVQDRPPSRRTPDATRALPQAAERFFPGAAIDARLVYAPAHAEACALRLAGSAHLKRALCGDEVPLARAVAACNHGPERKKARRSLKRRPCALSCPSRRKNAQIL